MDEEEKSSERKRLLKKLARIRKEKKIALQTLSERSDEYSSNNETWTCRRCTLVNEKDSLVCDACGSRSSFRQKTKRKKDKRKKKKRKNVQFLPDDDDSDDFTESLPTKDAQYSAKEDMYSSNVDTNFDKRKIGETKKKRRKLVAVDDNNIENKKHVKQMLNKRRNGAKPSIKNQLLVQPASSVPRKTEIIDLSIDEIDHNVQRRVQPHDSFSKIDFHNFKSVPKRRTAIFKSTHSKRRQNNNLLDVGGKFTSHRAKDTINDQWIDKYRPRSIEALTKGINKKKIAEIEQWMSNAAQSIDTSRRVLLLTGPSGVGKSTIVEVLAKKLSIDIREWRDSASDGTLDFKAWERLRLFSGGGRCKSDICSAQPRRIPQTEDLRRFLIRSKRYQALKLVKANSSSTNCASKGSTRNRPSIILLEYLPRPNKNDSYEAFHSVLTEFLKIRQGSPLIIIYSGCDGTQPSPSEMKKVFSQQFLASNALKEIQCRPVANTGMKRILKNIGASENLHLDASSYDSIIEQANGDLRHAIISLQHATNSNVGLSGFETFSNRNSKQKTRSAASSRQKDPSCVEDSKDRKYDMLHSIGKLLYAKRDVGTSKLQYDPDKLTSSIGMDATLLGSFLAQNGPGFYSDICDFGEFADVLSDIDIISKHEREMAFGHGRISKTESQPISSSLIARAISTTNKTPAKWKFTKIMRPQVLGIEKNAKENLSALSRSFTSSSVSKELRTETLPHLAKIIKSSYNVTTRIGTDQEDVLKQLCLFRGAYDPSYSSRIGTLNEEGVSIGKWTTKN